jgi:hypothetical protein
MTALVIDLAEERARRLCVKQGAAVRSSTAAMVSHKRIPLPDYAQPEPDRTELIDPAPVPERVEDETEQLEEIVWRTSGRGNPWTKIGPAHIVIFPSRRDEGEWCLRLEYDGRAARFLKRTWRSPEEAKAWVEANAHTVDR